MPYVDFAFVKAAVGGRQKMLALLSSHAIDRQNIDNDSAPHPWFESRRAIAEKLTNDAMTAAGLDVPNPAPDEWFMNGVSYVLVGLHDEAASNREKWQDNFKAWGQEFLAQIAAGVDVPGAEESPDSGASGVSGSFVDQPMYDSPGGYLTRKLLPPLGGSNFRGGGWQ